MVWSPGFKTNYCNPDTENIQYKCQKCTNLKSNIIASLDLPPNLMDLIGICGGSPRATPLKSTSVIKKKWTWARVGEVQPQIILDFSLSPKFGTLLVALKEMKMKKRNDGTGYLPTSGYCNGWWSPKHRCELRCTHFCHNHSFLGILAIAPSDANNDF